MKTTVAFCLLLALLPATGWAQTFSECDPIAKEMKSVDELILRVEDQIRQVDDQYTHDRGSEALKSKLRALRENREKLWLQKAEVTRRYNECTKKELQKRETSMKALIEEQTKTFDSKVKQFQNRANAATSDKSQVPNADTSAQSPALSAAAQPLVAMPSIPDNNSAPPPSSSSTLPSSGSGRTREQRAAALFAVNAELDRMPYLLPKKENAPSKSTILKLANSRNASARKSLSPGELAGYSKVVTWNPDFDGLSLDANKARDYSLLVSSVTNYFNKPQLIIALASAVFSLDPQSTANANNFASAIITAGERLNPKVTQAKALVPYRNDAETCFLYALANSMKGDAWTDESLTAIINLGNLYIDMGKPEEARSLFQVARKQSPFSWDAALGMAAYFHAVNKPDKALAILEDDDLDRPQSLMIAKKHAKALEKNDDVPIGSPDQLYEDRINSVTSAPIETAADFMSQIDQSARNKLRYFVENLPPKGSFTAPPIKKLTQYASLKAISAPPGISALKDFGQMLQIYSISSFASGADEQLKMLSSLGLKVNPGVDLNDVAAHPEKYANSKNRPKVKVDKTELMGNLESLRKQAETAKRELATGKTGSIIGMAAQVDPFFTILQIDPQDYADPMNIIMQKHNFAVHNRKTNLYNGYLYSVNQRTRQAFTDIASNYQRKIAEYAKIQADALEALEKRKGASGNSSNMAAEWALRKHNIHVQFFNSCNAAAESAFGSATNVATVAYVGKIKPKAEAFYYDVIRHVALISDPEVRDRKDSELHRAIYSALVSALSIVGSAHGSFKYHPEWECGCDLGSLLQQREAELAARDAEEQARLQRNKAAKVAFDSGEIPKSTPLFQKLDAYGFDFDYFFFKGRMSCAYTKVEFDLTIPFIPGSPKIALGQTISEFTGAGTYDQGIKVGFNKGDVHLSLDLSSSVTTDGQGSVKDYSITTATGLTVSAGSTKLSVGGQLTIGPNWTVRDSDFSAGVKTDFPIGKQYTGDDASIQGKVAFEASTKRGCSLSGEVEGSFDAAKNMLDEAKRQTLQDERYKESEQYKKSTDAEKRKLDKKAEDTTNKAAGLIPTDDLFQKSFWSRTFKRDDKTGEWKSVKEK